MRVPSRVICVKYKGHAIVFLLCVDLAESVSLRFGGGVAGPPSERGLALKRRLNRALSGNGKAWQILAPTEVKCDFLIEFFRCCGPYMVQ